MASEDDAAGGRGDGESPAHTAPMTGPEPEGIDGLDRDLAAGLVLGGRYQIGEHLGAGGMGVVYAARDRLLEMSVALKFVRPALARDPGEQSRLWKEVRLAQSITHRNVVRTFTLERLDGHLFIVMELLDGCALGERLREGPLPVAEAVRIATGILTGLAAAHDRDIVHRDIKPENIRLCGDDRVVVMDFGIARAQHVEGTAELHAGDPGRGAHTLLAGTPGYMAPEVVAGVRASAVSDLFSVGVVLREMLVGRGAREIAAALPAGLAAILDRMLAPDPDRRYRSAREVLAALDDLAAPPRSRRRLVVAAALVALSAAIAAPIAVAIVPGRGDRGGAVVPADQPPSFAALVDPARRWWPHPTIPICWEADKIGDELSWIHAAARGPGSWPSYVGVDLIGWRACDPASTGIRITAGRTMMAHTGVGRPPDGVARIEIDVGAAPERTWARCVAARLDRRHCIQAETLRLVGLVLGFSGERDPSPRSECLYAVGPTTANDTRSITTRCGAASGLQPLDLAAAQAVYGMKDDVDRGNLAVLRDEQRRPHLVAFLVDAAGQLQLATASGFRDRWQWTAAGGPIGWSGRFSVLSVLADRGRRPLRGFGIATDGHLYEHDGTGAAPVWHDRGGPGDLIGSPSAATYVDGAGRSRVHVFATSARRRLHEYTDSGAGGGWTDRGGAGVVGSPAAISPLDDDGRRVLDVFVRDDRGALRQLRAVDSSWTWIDRSHVVDEVPLRLVGAPSVSESLDGDGTRHVDVHIVGEDGDMWTLWSPGAGRWIWANHKGPGNLVGSTTFVRTAGRGDSRLNIFAVGAEGHLHQEVALPLWSFLDEGGPGHLAASPAAVAYADADETSRTDVVVVDADGRGHHLAWTPSTKRWTAMGGPRLAPIVR